MDVQLRFFANFREAVGGKTIDREFDDGVTVGEVLSALEAEFDDLAGTLIEDGDLKPQINVLRNGREVRHLDGIGTELDDGDTLSVFPPVAGGSREKSYRGISERLALRYLRNLGGEQVGEDAVEADGWRAAVSSEKVGVGPTMELTEVTVSFEGDDEVLDPLIERFSRKAMRAGG